MEAAVVAWQRVRPHPSNTNTLKFRLKVPACLSSINLGHIRELVRAACSVELIVCIVEFHLKRGSVKMQTNCLM